MAKKTKTRRAPARAARKKKAPAEQAGVISAKSKPTANGSKLDALIALLQGKDGATIAEMTKATGWQAHSVRGAISGTIKKKLGMKVASTKIDGVRTYRIAR